MKFSPYANLSKISQVETVLFEKKKTQNDPKNHRVQSFSIFNVFMQFLSNCLYT